MDADIVEIPSPIHLLKKQKRAILHDVIDIDDDDDSEDLVIIGEKVSKSNKGKIIEAIHQVVEVSDYTFCQPGVENFGPVSGIESSNGYPLVSHSLINVDGHGSALSYDNDDHIDVFSEDYANVDDVNIPPRTEAPFTWLPEYDLGLKKSTFKNSPQYDTQSDAKNSHVTDSSHPSWSLVPINSKIQGSIMGSSNLQIKMDNVDHSSGTELSSPQLFSQADPSKKISAASQCSGRDLNLSLGVESSKSKRFLKSFRSKMNSASFGSKNHGLAGNPEARKLFPEQHPKNEAATKFKSAKKEAGSSSSFHLAIDHCPHISSMKHPENWAIEIQKEWKILEKDLSGIHEFPLLNTSEEKRETLCYQQQMDVDIVESPPPIHLLKKQKRAILHDVIDIDDDDDSEDLVIIGEKVSKSNKEKTIEAIHQVVEVSDYTFCQPGVGNFGPVSGIESSNGYPLVSHHLINVDGHGSDLSYDGDDHITIFSEDYAM